MVDTPPARPAPPHPPPTVARPRWACRDGPWGFAEGRPAHVPDAPTHSSLVAARAEQPVPVSA